MLRKVIGLSYTIRQITPMRSVFTSRKNFKIYEPDYLDSLKSKFPQYECLNFQIQGYDYSILENYQKFLHNVADYLDLDVSDSFAVPPQKTVVQRFKPSSTAVEAEYNLTTYERNIQISDIDVPLYPLFLRIAQAALPEGVTLNVFEQNDEIDENRYVPDRDLLELKAQLETLQGTRESSKKK